jgi:hypothetical protein
VTYTTSTESEWFHRRLFNRATGVANADASLSVRVVTRRGVVVGGSGGGVVGGHIAKYEIGDLIIRVVVLC